MAEGFLVSNLVVRQSSEGFLAAVFPGEVIILTNAERAKANVGLVKENSQLDKAAQAKAADMAANGYFSHVGPNGKEPWSWIESFGYTYKYAGENLAVRFVDSKDVVQAWMVSPSHNANVVKAAYTDIGVGVAEGTYQGAPATFVVQYFASPIVVSNPPRVLGAEDKATIAPVQFVVRTLARIQAEPLVATEWALGVVAAILVVSLLLAFFVHIHIQSVEMLAAGATVAACAVVLLFSNMQFINGPLQKQSASVFYGAAYFGGVVIDPMAASIERQPSIWLPVVE